MKRSIVVTAAASLLAFAPFAFATERYDHFKGKPSETLVEAVRNFSECNEKLEAVLNGKLDDNAMHTVHELTYTLENALEKINSELAALADTLEEVHQASERHDHDAVLRYGREYLEVSRQVVR